jgi:hypothetical protein
MTKLQCFINVRKPYICKVLPVRAFLAYATFQDNLSHATGMFSWYRPFRSYAFVALLEGPFEGSVVRHLTTRLVAGHL